MDHNDKCNFAAKPFTAKLEIIENELANMLIKIFQDAEGYRVGENPNPKGKTYSENTLSLLMCLHTLRERLDLSIKVI